MLPLRWGMVPPEVRAAQDLRQVWFALLGHPKESGEGMIVKSPAFQFYPKDWLADGNVRAMGHEARGIYIDLLAIYWNDGGLPADTQSLARRVCVPSRTFQRLWPLIEPCFQTDGNSITSLRLEAEKAKQAAYRTMQQEKGLKSAKSRVLSKTDQPRLDSVAVRLEPEVNSPSPSSIPSPSPKKNSVIKATSSKTPERISLEADHQIEEDRLSENFRSIQESGLQIQPVLDSLPRSPSRSPFSAYRWLKGLGSGVPISKPGVTVLRLLNDAIEAYGRGQATPTASPKLRSNFYAIARITRAAAPLLQTVNPASIEGESL